ncbi:hypothetical protein H5410_027731 [Solanum commersonii]|uniref:Uncharacterized protein n=1 Tax=Solanum commersonii TaxID=4109 RepID=A0A9J5Z2W7_SOLCO|nr:hypothetical protein H5410_027731 [Solanum commersonii]
MTGLRDAWRRHEQKIKERFFDKNSTIEDMLAKCPDGIPEVTFRQLIEYWKHPTIKGSFGKEQPGRLRCYGRSVTTGSLKEDKLTNKIKQKHTNEISSLKVEINDMIAKLRYFFSQLLQNNHGLNVQDIPGVVGSNLVSPVDASSAQAVRCQNISHFSGSTYDSVLQNVFCWFLKTFLSFIDVSNCEDGFLVLLGCWFDPAQQDHYS